MDFSKVCRTCLSSSSLNPIFKNIEGIQRYTTALYMCADIKVKLNDGLPQNMCAACITFLNNCLKFRRQCKNAENQLLNIKNKVYVNCDLSDRCEDKKPVIYTADQLEIKTNYSDTDVDDEKPVVCKIEFDDTSIDENAIGESVEPVGEARKRKTKRTKCKICYESLSLRSLPNHMARRHPELDGSPMRCGHCKSEYDSKDMLLEHIKVCTAKKKRRINNNKSHKEMTQCDICEKRMQKASLKMHKAIKHAGLRPVCEHCGRGFGNKFRLNEHYRAKHGYEKLKCSYCDFRSAGAMAMRDHERRHRGEKPFVCEACGAKFHAAYLLAQHKQSHRTEKIYKCDRCPASFKANNSLHMHKSTCHSTAEYKCTICPRIYASRHYVVKHMRHVHRYSGTVPKLEALRNSVKTANDIDKMATVLVNGDTSSESKEMHLDLC